MEPFDHSLGPKAKERPPLIQKLRITLHVPLLFQNKKRFILKEPILALLEL
jgi:hypothetical protein